MEDPRTGNASQNASGLPNLQKKTNRTLRSRVVLFQRFATGQVERSSHPHCSYAPQNVVRNPLDPVRRRASRVRGASCASKRRSTCGCGHWCTKTSKCSFTFPEGLFLSEKHLPTVMLSMRMPEPTNRNMFFCDNSSKAQTSEQSETDVSSLPVVTTKNTIKRG